MAHEINLELVRALDMFDLATWLLKHGAEHAGGDEWVLRCPVCGKAKLAVNAAKRVWHCWVCQAESGRGSGGVVSLVARVEGRRAADVIAELVSRVAPRGMPLHSVDWFATAERAELVLAAQWPEVDLPESWRPATAELPYLAARCITEAQASAFNLGWCASGRYAQRLIFPVFEGRRLVYYQGRAMWSKVQQSEGRYVKALNPPRVEGHARSSDLLLNLDSAAAHDRVAIVEGPIDCVKAGASAVATFGKRLHARQLWLLLRSQVRAVDLCWDGPGPTEPLGALPEMLAIAPTLGALGIDVRIVRLPSGDPGERTTEEIDYWRAKALSAQDFSRSAFL